MKEYRHYIHQVGTIKTLLEGHLESEVTIAELLRYGNYGFGTLNHTNGDFVIIDGQPVHMNQFNEHHGLNGREKVPYGAVFHYSPQVTFDIIDTHHTYLFERIKEKFKSDQLFSITIITGFFNELHLSIYTKQENRKPSSHGRQSLPLTQLERAVREMTGTLLILYTPHEMSGIHPPGFSAYFVSEYHHIVGKVLSFNVVEGRAALQSFDGFSVICPAVDPLFIQYFPE
ncbi:acetolactate decarboxylase [Staphylococcus lutrae]|uniref:Alpha-acetolactate decarboxylase n=1 Tax=Staphylococcus lutrae TaxID=155085 RepID=A0AAC9RU04_9STAP|nr:acetolactate decarboxylase [Staphylococcus lutrae]ARJ50710.1 alpha-acetolactate decarboxylase [Staphylococcus lutrae]PNZ34758.1 alpha-acetolactate decarboxylase [Staphylococcus lutrae]